MQRLALFIPAALMLVAMAVPGAVARAASPLAPPGFLPVSITDPSAGGPSLVYIRVTQPDAVVEMLLPPGQDPGASRSYRVATYRVDCQAGGVKYDSVRTVDAASHLPVSSLQMPKTVWHQPRAGSAEAGALGRACGR